VRTSPHGARTPPAGATRDGRAAVSRRSDPASEKSFTMSNSKGPRRPLVRGASSPESSPKCSAWVQGVSRTRRHIFETRDERRLAATEVDPGSRVHYLVEPMSLHLLKLCVGVDTISDLEARIAERLEARRRRKETPEIWHTTRMAPKRAAELLDGGSIFWVIKGQVSARQTLLGVDAFIDEQGVSRCRLGLEAKVVAVRPRSCRPFQGWRYLPAADAPVDLGEVSADARRLPDALRLELTRLGLL
jgi:hypothetical protein